MSNRTNIVSGCDQASTSQFTIACGDQTPQSTITCGNMSALQSGLYSRSAGDPVPFADTQTIYGQLCIILGGMNCYSPVGINKGIQEIQKIIDAEVAKEKNQIKLLEQEIAGHTANNTMLAEQLSTAHNDEMNTKASYETIIDTMVVDNAINNARCVELEATIVQLTAENQSLATAINTVSRIHSDTITINDDLKTKLAVAENKVNELSKQLAQHDNIETAVNERSQTEVDNVRKQLTEQINAIKAEQQSRLDNLEDRCKKAIEASIHYLDEATAAKKTADEYKANYKAIVVQNSNLRGWFANLCEVFDKSKMSFNVDGDITTVIEPKHIAPVLCKNEVGMDPAFLKLLNDL